MIDYTYPSVYLAYGLFAILAGGAVYFFIRSLKDGYLGPNSEEPKYRMLEDETQKDETQAKGASAPRRA